VKACERHVVMQVVAVGDGRVIYATKGNLSITWCPPPLEVASIITLAQEKAPWLSEQDAM